jgi:hypothetical protein
MAGVVVVSAFMAFYQVGWLEVSGRAQGASPTLSGELKAMDGDFPPPPSFP